MLLKFVILYIHFIVRQTAGIVGDAIAVTITIIWPIQFDTYSTLALAVINPDNEDGHCYANQPQADKFIKMGVVYAGKSEGQQTKHNSYTVDDIANLPDAQTSCHEAVMQVRLVIMCGGLPAPYAVDNHDGNVKNWHAKHHQRQRQFRAAHN